MQIDDRNGQGIALIQSMPTVYNNYGGLLQAYAMQLVLRRQGVRSFTNTGTNATSSVRNIVGSALWLTKHRSLDRRISPRNWRHRSRALIEFADSNLQTMNRIYKPDEMQDAVDNIKAGYAIAGSDQVWRPRYSNVLAGTFEAVESGTVRKIAYAASFGLGNTCEFDPGLKERFGRALRDFSFVGVRESSALEICREEFGVEAEHVLDPTMLILPDDWEKLSVGTLIPDRARAEPYLFYIGLDHDSAAKEKSQLLASRLGLEFRELYGPDPVSRKEFRQNPGSYVLPRVEEWIATIRHASLVITDSFHVTAFSIMFETPFLVLDNPVRGNARLDSLLNTFGLHEQRTTVEALSGIRGVPGIYWPEVRGALDRRRERSETFLKRALL